MINLEFLHGVGIGSSGWWPVRRELEWPDEVKARIVAETLPLGATVNGAAQQHGVLAHHVSSWRTLARKGRLVLPAPDDPVEFAALMVGEAEKPGEERLILPRARKSSQAR
ncbi:transposase [Brucella pseudintermedia]|uniref:Transposase n=1 Tax=Brucella pseudintermedia TaxID=370111 RepID=A0ABY5UG95_9HYPH|nr:transposase [Brucella pseudintermedia]UWL61382.1 transposase [Brucella pseudintermedia]